MTTPKIPTAFERIDDVSMGDCATCQEPAYPYTVPGVSNGFVDACSVEHAKLHAIADGLISEGGPVKSIFTTQTDLEQILKDRNEYPVTDPAKREAYAKGLIVGLDGEEIIVPETNPLYAMVIEAAAKAGQPTPTVVVVF